MDFNGLKLKVKFIFEEPEFTLDSAYSQSEIKGVSAGYDIRTTETKILEPLERHAFSTGIRMGDYKEEGFDRMGLNWYIRVAPRSGLSLNCGIDTMAGVIDSSYRGEIKIILINLSKQSYKVNRGDKIAQLIFEPIILPKIVKTDKVVETTRGSGGFGSSDLVN